MASGRAKHSTQHAIIDIISNIYDNIDKGLFSCGILIGLKSL
jgi:hypothetical protein